MRQRLALARALLNKPELLFLDEPTAGLDPEVAKQVHDLIQNVRLKDGHTVVLCTHHLYEAERLCDRMAVMSKGYVIAIGTLEQLRQIAAPEHWIKFTFMSQLFEKAVTDLKIISGVVDHKELDSKTLIVQVKKMDVVPALVSYFVEKDTLVTSVEPQSPSLEQIYFRLQQRAEVFVS
jgi:ABC-2 type transport system ATP-binding protein